MNYTDFTENASAGLSEAWVNIGGYSKTRERWIPRLVVQRTSEGDPLVSTFVSVYVPDIDGDSTFKAQRLLLMDEAGTTLPDTHVALQVEQPDGGYDIVVLRAPELPGKSQVPGPNGTVLSTDGDVSLLRMSNTGHVAFAALAKGTRIQLGDFVLKNETGQDVVSIQVP